MRRVVPMCIGGRLSVCWLVLASVTPLPADEASASDSKTADHDALTGKPALTAAAHELKRTVVTAHLEYGIEPGANVLWCSTFQLAWNELAGLGGGAIKYQKKVEMVTVLNRSPVRKEDLDDASYVALAGTVGGGVYRRINKALKEKFGGRAAPVMASASGPLPPDGCVAYAYLFKHLPFESPFTRFSYPLRFGKAKVASFGIADFYKGLEAEMRMARQVAVLDYKSESDFIIELKTKAKKDRLILAKVAPSDTLSGTISEVRRRAATSRSTEMQEEETLRIPVFDFDLLREYTELHGLRIDSKTEALSGQRLARASQRIRFRLDQDGVALLSEASIDTFGAPPRLFLFDKPFLVLLQRANAKNPYFALWVANAELMVPFEEFP